MSTEKKSLERFVLFLVKVYNEEDFFVQNTVTRIKDLKNSHKILAHWVHSAEDLTRKLGLIKREKINRLIVRFFLF